MQKISLKHSIVTRLLKVVFGLYLVVTVVLTATQMYTEYKLTQNAVHSEINKIPKTYGPSLANALWTYNEEGLHTLLKGMYEISAVSGIKITFENEVTAIGAIEKKDGTRAVYDRARKLTQQKYDTLYGSLTSVSFPIFYTPDKETREKVGTGTIYSSSAVVFNRVKDGFILILISALLKTLSLWFIFFYFIKKILAEPLTQLTDATQKIDISNLSTSKISIESKEHDELYLLEKSFNSMISSLAKSINDLDVYQANLEDIVGERTKELTVEIKMRKEAQITAEKASELKNTFMANVSHELRTPMTSIYGMTRYLESIEGEPDKKSQLKLIDRNCVRLISLINEVLDFSKLKSNTTVIEAEFFNLEKCVTGVIETLEILASEKNIELRFTITNTPAEIYGDDAKLTQILINLINNAIKFTPSGCIHVTVTLLENNADYLHFAITDTGIGIAKDLQDHIFDEFTQVDGSTSRQHAGTGLGLAIVKEYLKIMGGRIWLESKKDEGSTFYFTLPVTYKKL